jgi:hypothetical protein
MVHNDHLTPLSLERGKHGLDAKASQSVTVLNDDRSHVGIGQQTQELAASTIEA